jgi:hypothetical protein
MGLFKKLKKAFKKAVDVVVGAVTGIISGIGKIFQPFGFSPDIPDYGFDEQGGTQADAIQGVLLNKDSAIAHVPVVYGTRMVGGIRVFVSTNGSTNQYLYVALVLAEGQVNAATQLLIDDNTVTISSLDHGVERTCTTGRHKDRLKAQFFDGRDDQTVSSLLQEAPNWTSNHRLRGLAYIALRFEWKKIETQTDAENNPFGGGVPNVRVKLEGKKVYDATTLTADSTTAHDTAYADEPTTFTDNPVSCLLDYLRNPRFGKNLPTTAFAFDTWKTAADLCNQNVNFGTGTEKAFTCDAVLDTAQTLMNNTKIQLAGFRGIMPFTQGKYRLLIEHGGDDSDITATPASPSTVFTVDNDTIVGGMTLVGEDKENKVNRCVVTYVDPDADFQPNQVIFPAAGSSDDTAFLAADNGIRLEKSITLPTVTSRVQALQYAEVFLKRSRASKQVSFQTTIATSNVTVGDLVQVVNEHLSLSQIFRISEIVVTEQGQIAINAFEHQSGTYAVNAKTADITRPTISLPDPALITAPTNLTCTSGSAQNLTGTDTTGYFNTPSLSTVRRIKVAWTASTDPFVTEYRIQFKLSSASDFTEAGTTNLTEFFLAPVTLAAPYDVRVAARNELDNQSSFATVSNHTVSA